MHIYKKAPVFGRLNTPFILFLFRHSILGNAANFLRIDIETGDVYVSRDDYFDYQRQNEIIVQVNFIIVIVI